MGPDEKSSQSHYSGTTTPTSVSEASLSVSQGPNPNDAAAATADTLRKGQETRSIGLLPKQQVSKEDSRILKLIGNRSVLQQTGSRAGIEPAPRRYRQPDSYGRLREERRDSFGADDAPPPVPEYACAVSNDTILAEEPC